jgi:hypothetical protein
MKTYLPDVILLVCGVPMVGLLLYLGAMSEGWLPPLCYLGAAVIFTGWQRTLITLGWRLSGKDPDDIDFHFPG